MFPRTPHTKAHGFTFIELLVTAAVTALIFTGLMASVQLAVKLISTAKAKTGAVSLATERLEYIRSLAYADIGTIAGIPPGNIPQQSTRTLNSITYHERVLIQYVDAPDDGLGASDDNGILADYKRAKVEYSWLGPNGTNSIALLSDIAPPGIESTAGGGTIAVNVFDANVQPVQGAAVRVINTTTTSTIDTTQYTNASGIAFFAGAPAASQYELIVTKAGYSTDSTYVATTSNPDPITPPVAVLEGAVSTMNFRIDLLSRLTVRTVEPATTDLFEDDFSDGSLVESMTDTTLTGGSIVLTGSPGTYSLTGTVFATTTEPTSFDAWGIASWNATTDTDTTVRIHVYDVSGGVYTLVSEGDLPGNAAGFSGTPIILSGLNPAAHPALALGASLGTANVNVTPELHDWELTYITDEPPIGNVAFTLESERIIGTTPIYKYQELHTTDGGGQVEINDLEWGLYKIFLSSGAYDISQACSALPLPLDPNVNETLTLTLVPPAPRTLRVSVVDASGAAVAGASVELSRSGFSDQETTSACGQVFFNSGIASAVDYVIDVSASGYVDHTVTDINIDGTETLEIILTPV